LIDDPFIYDGEFLRVNGIHGASGREKMFYAWYLNGYSNDSIECLTDINSSPVICIDTPVKDECNP